MLLEWNLHFHEIENGKFQNRKSEALLMLSIVRGSALSMMAKLEYGVTPRPKARNS